MPVNGIMAFCTFYDRLDKLRPLARDAFDYGYKGTSGLTPRRRHSWRLGIPGGRFPSAASPRPPGTAPDGAHSSVPLGLDAAHIRRWWWNPTSPATGLALRCHAYPWSLASVSESLRQLWLAVGEFYVERPGLPGTGVSLVSWRPPYCFAPGRMRAQWGRSAMPRMGRLTPPSTVRPCGRFWRRTAGVHRSGDPRDCPRVSARAVRSEP
jgi:hypothetical protein